MIIGITTTYIEKDHIEGATAEYIQRVAAAGATAVLLPPVEGGPHENQRAARELIERIDGLVLAGGGDVAPAHYGDVIHLPETTLVSETRDALELELARLAHEFDVPTLGVCRGMQVLNVALGGSLYQDMHACGITATKHQQEPPYYTTAQRIDIAPGSLLEQALCAGAGAGMVQGCKAGWPAALEVGNETEISSACSILVNSMHHQAVAKLAPSLLVSAISNDGVIEGVEDPTRRFFLGVQWHPEYLDNNMPLFQALVNAAR